MASTSPDGLWSPDAGNNYNLTSDLATMQATTQAALTGVKSSATDLAARVSAAEALLTDTGWVNAPVASGIPGSCAYRVKYGIVYIRSTVNLSSLTPNVAASLLASPLPAGARPTAGAVISAVATQSADVVPAPLVTGGVQTGGDIRVMTSSTANRSVWITASYPAA